MDRSPFPVRPLARRALWGLALGCLLAIVAPSVATAGDAAPTGAARAREEQQILTTHRGYTDAVRAYDWASAATFFDPTALASIRETMAPIVGMAGDDGKTLADELFGMTAEQVGELDDAGFFGAFMTGVMAMSPGIGEAMAAAVMTEKGVAFGEAGEAFVVYEMQVSSNEIEMKKLAVTPMVRGADGAWALEMTGEFKGLAEAFQRMATEQATQQAAQAAEAEAAEADGAGGEAHGTDEADDGAQPAEESAPKKTKKKGKKGKAAGN